jgi:transcriptional antiterminator NusG
MKMQWYVIQASSNMEKKVVDTLKEKIKQNNMTEYFGEILFPEEDQSQQVNGKKRIVKKKVFPGYVLIQMIAEPKSIQLVKSIPKVLAFVSHNQLNPTPLSDQEANDMLKRQKEGFTVKSDYSVGDTVKITNGPFASFKGIVEHVNNDSLRVSVNIFGRPTPLDNLKFVDVMKVIE